MLVSDVIVDQIVTPYSNVVLVMAVLSSVSLIFPQCVVASFVCVLRKCVWNQMFDLVFLYLCLWLVLCCL